GMSGGGLGGEGPHERGRARPAHGAERGSRRQSRRAQTADHRRAAAAASRSRSPVAAPPWRSRAASGGADCVSRHRPGGTAAGRNGDVLGMARAMKVTPYGVRGSLAAPGPATARYGGNTSCVCVTTSDGVVLALDAGTGLRTLALPPELRRVDVLLTHLHMDHIIGL